MAQSIGFHELERLKRLRVSEVMRLHRFLGVLPLNRQMEEDELNKLFGVIGDLCAPGRLVEAEVLRTGDDL